MAKKQSQDGNPGNLSTLYVKPRPQPGDPDYTPPAAPARRAA